jgi:phage tail-like protein
MVFSEITKDHTRAISFYLEFDNVQQGLFQSVTGGKIDIEVVEYVASGVKGEWLKAKQPGKISYSNIVLQRGHGDDMKLYNWIQDIVDGKIASSRKNGSVTGYDDQGNEVYKVNFERAWPKRYKGLDFDAKTNEVKVEEVEVVCEKLVRVM